MEGYISEKEQLQEIKKWWQEHGKYIAIAIAIGLLIGWGWRYWHQLQTRRVENASMIYQSVLDADVKNQTTTAQGGAKILQKNFAHSPYASLASMVWAKEAIANQKIAVAIQQLEWVLSHSKEKRLQDLSHLSLARIFLSQSKAEQASTQLQAISTKTFEPMVNWLRGDIAAQKGDIAAARKYYQTAKDDLMDTPPAAVLLSMKMAQP